MKVCLNMTYSSLSDLIDRFHLSLHLVADGMYQVDLLLYADAPPALSKLASQVAAMTVEPDLSGPSPTATVTPKYTASNKPAPIKSGFFNTSKAKKTAQSSRVCQ